MIWFFRTQQWAGWEWLGATLSDTIPLQGSKTDRFIQLHLVQKGSKHNLNTKKKPWLFTPNFQDHQLGRKHQELTRLGSWTVLGPENFVGQTGLPNIGSNGRDLRWVKMSSSNLMNLHCLVVCKFCHCFVGQFLFMPGRGWKIKNGWNR